MVIRQSFLSLLGERELSGVTVADICRLAEINRATLYRHYESPQAILRELERELLEQVPFPPEGESPEAILSGAIGGLWEKREEWKPLLRWDSGPDLPAKLYHFLRERLPWPEESSPSDPGVMGEGERARRFLLHGLSGLLTDWMTGGFLEPAEQMTACAVQYYNDLTGRA